jgi:hypothetical protein
MRADVCSSFARMPWYAPAASGIRSAPRIPATGPNGSSWRRLALLTAVHAACDWDPLSSQVTGLRRPVRPARRRSRSVSPLRAAQKTRPPNRNSQWPLTAGLRKRERLDTRSVYLDQRCFRISRAGFIDHAHVELRNPGQRYRNRASNSYPLQGDLGLSKVITTTVRTAWPKARLHSPSLRSRPNTADLRIHR